MIQKIFLIVLVLFSVSYAKNIKPSYLDEDKFSYLNVKPFIGLELSYAYMRNASTFDSTVEAYSYYVGLPIYQYEIILKRKFSDTKDFEIKTNSVILNIPISGSGTDLFYVGLVGGKAQVRWDTKEVNRFSLNKQYIEEGFYGLHIGNKYKFHRNFYVKIEFEYLKYDIEDKDLPNDVYIDKSFDFIYGIEYRF